MLLCLLGTLGATQQLLRATASLAPRQLSLGPWRGDGDAAPYAGAPLCRAATCGAPWACRALSALLDRLPGPHSFSCAAPHAGCYATQALDAAAHALQDTITVALYRLADAFGEGLAKVGCLPCAVLTPLRCHPTRRAWLLMPRSAPAH